MPILEGILTDLTARLRPRPAEGFFTNMVKGLMPRVKDMPDLEGILKYIVERLLPSFDGMCICNLMQLILDVMMAITGLRLPLLKSIVEDLVIGLIMMYFKLTFRVGIIEGGFEIIAYYLTDLNLNPTFEATMKYILDTLKVYFVLYLIKSVTVDELGIPFEDWIIHNVVAISIVYDVILKYGKAVSGDASLSSSPDKLE